ncbi:hypothetical protein MATL_G00200960 [Megalops atlanticus]|uniref:CRAL-TRIO domain-containing protein n=1 Tax=Megalops atlanticus TaxID=7932 RepID=A0A9D3PL99_MEGAT|nr:hypothetical protein MATL_G00200960 [Megalops atlanticus]
MSSNATEFQKSSPSPPLPPDHVLNSGAVTFPGTFDQQGCPLVVFPVEEHHKLPSSLTKEEVADFVNYFLRLHNKYQEKEAMVSVVVDLRQATLTTTRFITETLLLLELHKRTVHTLYVVQPRKKEVLKLLLKLLVSSHSKHYISAPFKRVFLKEISELPNYIDRSQLTATLGGYLIYCHQSWVTFIKEIDAFVQDFLSVVHRLPSCISTLQSLSRQTVPTGLEELRDFCSVNEARFLQLRRDLGLDELLRHCETVVEKLRYPENEPCYQAMAGTALFTHTAYDMLQNYSRITAAVEKVELLWQQAFSRAHLQLKVLQLGKEAQQIIEQIDTTRKEKLQPYRIEIAKDAKRAEILKVEFERSIYTPAMALVRRAEDVIHTLEETVPVRDSQAREEWVEELERVKESFRTAVELPHQTLRAVSDFYYYYNRSKSWYNMVLCENFLQDLLWGGTCEGLYKQRYPQDARGGGAPMWRRAVCDFLRRSPSPEMEELVQLAHLANVIPDSQLQQSGKQLSHRCMILRKLLTSPGAVPLNDLQLALQWQYEFLRSSQRDAERPHAAGLGLPERAQSPAEGSGGRPRDGRRCPGYTSDIHSRQSRGALPGLNKWDCGKEPLSNVGQGTVPPLGKPPSLSSFDSGFDGAGSSHLDGGAGREGWEGLSKPHCTREAFRPIVRQPQIHEENISSVSDSEDCREEFEFGAVGGGAGAGGGASIQIIPKITLDSLNFEIKVKRSATMPKNPWLSLPVEDLENSYTVTITPTPQTPLRDAVRSPDLSDRSRDQPTQTEAQASTQTLSGGEEEPSLAGAGRVQGGAKGRLSILQSQDSFEDSDLSPIRNVLSSTITDARDKPNSTMDSVPTLLWDTYDFHNNKQDTCERLLDSLTEVSLTDWDLKEQEGLREVEEILDRAAGILQAKENVLVQEEMLDVLLKAESGSKQWASWGGDEQLSTVTLSSSDLVEAGVVGLEDDQSLCTDRGVDCTPPEPESSRHDSSDFASVNEGSGQLDAGAPSRESSRCDVLQELKGLHVLEQRIMDENLKIHEFRRCEQEEQQSEQRSEQSGGKRPSKERQLFLRELEKEKREVEKLEKSLDKEMAKGAKVKNRLSRGRKVVKCSIMERTSKLKNLEDGALCDKLISGSKSQVPNKTQPTPGQQDDTTCIPAESSAGVTLSGRNQDCSSKPELSQDVVRWSPENVESSASNRHIEDSPSACPHVPADEGNALCSSGKAVLAEPSAPSHASEGDRRSPLRDLPAPTVCATEVEDCCPPGETELEQLACETVEPGESKTQAVDGAQSHIPEASLTPSTCPNPGAFDPGGDMIEAPVPKPRRASRPPNPDKGQVLCSEEEAHKMCLALVPIQDNPHARLLLTAEGPKTPPKPRERKNKPSANPQAPAMSPAVSQHSNNNNNKTPLSEQPSLPCAAPESTSTESSDVSPRESAAEATPASPKHPPIEPDADAPLSPSENTPAADPPCTEKGDSPQVCPEEAPLASGGLLEGAGVWSEVNTPAEWPSQDSGAAVRSVCRSPVNENLLHINTQALTDFKTPIVLDTGSGLVKAGFADQDLPATIFPTVIGIPKYEEIMNGNFERESYIGHEAQHMRGVLSLKYPMKNGIVRNWDEMEKIWHHTFQQLHVDPEEHPVLLSEAAMNPRENRQRMVELMFEAFSVPYAYVAMQAVLALYAAGRTTGVVFDSGDGSSHSVPVFEGYCLPHAVQRFTLAGMDVTLHLRKLLQEQGVAMRTSAELEIVREMKERCCCVAQDYEAELCGGGPAGSEVCYTMPDGQVICLGSERFRATEILFKPELIGRDHYGMHESIFKSILHSDIDLRRSFVGNIVLSGGNTLLAGLPQRLQSEIRNMVPADLGESVRVTSPKDRDFSVWSGGAVLASLPSFASAWISEEEYEEFGPEIVFRKCF